MDITHIIDSLNPEQRKAATHLEGNLLVLAGAGSGKTRTIVHRIAYLIITGQAHWHQILAVTFTNKAANELKSRVSALLPNQNQSGIWTGTFHSTCYKMLRIHAESIQLAKNFQVIDADDQLRIIRKIHSQLKLDEQQWPAKKSLGQINHFKEQGLRSQQCYSDQNIYVKNQSDIYALYEQHCQANNLVDFPELILKTCEMLKEHEDIRWQYQTQFKHLLIDEFQDTNKLQYQLIQLLNHPEQRIVAVGDDDQSIYSWRGAIVDHMFSFEKDFPPTETIRLEQNYRSTKSILTAANHLIQCNTHRLAKELWTDNTNDEKLKLYAAYNEIDEAQFICDQILELTKGNHSLNDFAILYRSNAQSRVFEEKFGQEGIPYRVYGGLRFFERAEIKDVLAYLRLIANPDDNYAFERSVNPPPRGIGKATIDKIKRYAHDHNMSLYLASQHIDITGKAKSSMIQYHTLIDSAKSSHDTLSQLLKHIVDHIQIIDYLKAQKTPQTESKIENVEELSNATKYYDQNDSLQDALEQFLSHAVLDQSYDQTPNSEQVQLMTLHAAKGLEFPVVFLVGIEDDLFPHKMTHNDDKQIEEERRLCYVGITRAKSQLFLSYAETRKHYGQELYQRPSRFLREIPTELLKHLRAQHQAMGMPISSCTYKFNLGQAVFHEKFGDGVVLNYEEDGDNSRIQVRFSSAGTKWLLCAYANLQIQQS